MLCYISQHKIVPNLVVFMQNTAIVSKIYIRGYIFD